MHHYSYGSGMVGCLYDNGPHYVVTLRDAIAGALLPFIDQLTTRELRAARRDLRVDGIHYFPSKRRAELGADYCELSKQDGPCPEGDE